MIAEDNVEDQKKVVEEMKKAVTQANADYIEINNKVGSLQDELGYLQGGEEQKKLKNELEDLQTLKRKAEGEFDALVKEHNDGLVELTDEYGTLLTVENQKWCTHA